MKHIFLGHDLQESPAERVHLLETAGYDVVAFADPVELLERVSTACPDLVMLDVLLDGPNGFEVCRRIRAEYDAKELPILMSSAIYRGHAFQEEAASAGAQGYLVRPLVRGELLSALNSVLRFERAA